jgi:hypothetical protein
MYTIKKILFISAAILISHNCFSQVKFGIEGGLNFSNANVSSINGDEKTDIRTGMILGGFFEFNTSDNLSIQPGIRYIQRGSTYDNGVVKLTQQVNYIEFPVTCNLIIDIKKFKPFVSGGFYIGYHVFAMQKQNYSAGDYYEYDVGDFYKSSDIGYIIGGGLNYEVSRLFTMFVTANYSGGMKNVMEDGVIADVKNTGYQLSTGIKIRL